MILLADVETLRSPKALVHGRQLGALSYLFEISCTPDQGARRRFGGLIGWRSVEDIFRCYSDSVLGQMSHYIYT